MTWKTNKKTKKKFRVDTPPKLPFKAGDYIYASWGYDQTNIDFAQIVKISPTGKTLVARMVRRGIVNEESTRMADAVVPVEPYGKEFRLQIRSRDRADGTQRFSLVGSYPFIYSDQSSKRKGYFTLWDGMSKFQTNSQFGH